MKNFESVQSVSLTERKDEDNWAKEILMECLSEGIKKYDGGELIKRINQCVRAYAWTVDEKELQWLFGVLADFNIMVVDDGLEKAVNYFLIKIQCY